MSQERLDTPEQPKPYILNRIEITQGWANRFKQAAEAARAYRSQNLTPDTDENTQIRMDIRINAPESMAEEKSEEAEALQLLYSAEITPDSRFMWLMEITPMERYVLSLVKTKDLSQIENSDIDIFESRILPRAITALRALHPERYQPNNS